MDWIPVTDRLPPFGKNVLVFSTLAVTCFVPQPLRGMESGTWHSATRPSSWRLTMKRKGLFTSLWKKDKEEGVVSILYKLLFLILVFGLVLLLVLEKAGGGMGWVFARFPILKKVVEDVSPVSLYLFWLISLWLGFKIGKHVGMKRGAVNERRKLGIAF